MTAPLASIEAVSVVYGGVLRAVDNVSFAIRPGETLGLVGESGSGKTTVSKLILGLLRPTEGRVLFDGRDVHALPAGERRWFRRQAQMIFQDPISSLSPRLTIRSLLEEPLRIHGLPLKEHWPRMRELMDAIGIKEALLDKHPHQVSGGQARRVGIARALVLNPRLVVADEPTAGLDVSIQGDLLNLMHDLQGRFGLTYLLVSHNLSVVRTVTDEVAVMYLGRLVEHGPTRTVFARPAHPYTRALIAANPMIDPDRLRKRATIAGEIPSPTALPPGCRFQTRCPKAQTRCRVEDPALLPVAGPERTGQSAACHFPNDAPERP